MSRHLPARLTLLLGVVAVGLVVLPAIIFDQPLPWSARNKAADQADDRPQPSPTHRLTVKIKQFEFALGKSTTQPTAAPTAPPPPPPSPAKPYLIAAVLFALSGLITGPIAWTTTRRHRPLVVTGMTLCCAAILWHYVVAGLIAGVAVAILLFILSAAGG